MVPQSQAAQFPLHLCEVLEGELEALVPEEHGRGPGGQPWHFTVGHIRREALPGLLARLRDPADEVCARLRARLPKEFLDALERGNGGDGPSARDLAEALNRLLIQADLHSDLVRPCRNDRIHLSAEMEMLLANPPADTVRLNRLLLEEALPGTFEKALDERLAAVYERFHARELSALCLSGGGIRSAVFSLGVAQGLARRGLLRGFDYLSTVSGGGYLGGMLSAWIHRHPRGLEGVSAELAGKQGPGTKLDPEPGPLGYLRDFSNYLTPRTGLLSADSWTLASIFIRNLYLHWLVSIPLLMAVLALPRLYVGLLREIPEAGFSLPLPWTQQPARLLPEGLFALGSLLMTLAVAYIGWFRPSGGRRSTQRGFLNLCLVPLAFSAVALTLYWARLHGLGRPLFSPFGLATWIVVSANLINWTGWGFHSVRALVSRRVPFLAKLREIPLLACGGTAGGLLTFLMASRVFRNPVSPEVLSWYAVFAVPALLGAFILGETLFAGLAGRWTDDEDREWWARCAAWLLIVLAVWIVVTGVVIYGPILLAYQGKIFAPLGGLAGLATALLARSSRTSGGDRGQEGDVDIKTRLVNFGLACAAPIFVLFLLSAVSLGMSWLLYAYQRWQYRTAFVPLPSFDDENFSAMLSAWHRSVILGSSLTVVAGLLVLSLIVGLVMALLIDVNKFSLHAMYRNRIIRTFLGASRSTRRPNPFTGFDSEDNLPICQLRKPLFLRRENLKAGAALLCRRLREDERLSSQQVFRHLSADTRRALAAYDPGKPPPAALAEDLVEDLNRLIGGRFDDDLLEGVEASEDDRQTLKRARSDDERFRLQRDLLLKAFQDEIDLSIPPKPLHIVNVALNLVGGKRLAWQQRKAQSFTFSPLHCGSLRLGYRASETYGRGGLNRRAVSLGTAMAISGAAASPNMGYHSSPAITFLMAFFNARFGWWLGNPGVAGAHTYQNAHPTFAVGPLLDETLGLTDDRNSYVYLSDGGHFENLGLYEMVLRRCRNIVVVDAGQDQDCSFEDLGNAIRKIRIDLGIRIDLRKLAIQAEPGEGARYCALGTIHYPETIDGKARKGTLLYLKPALCGDEPRDILHYKALNKKFPHEPTSDQWFSESQFESYRMLGAHAIEAICTTVEGKEIEIAGLPDLFECSHSYVQTGYGTVPRPRRTAAEAPPAEPECDPANTA